MQDTLFGKRILILVPHPDDEVVACCAAIGQAQQADAKIFTLYLTHGCIARETLWAWQRKNYENYVERRREEAAIVARFLGITSLNWPVRPARHLWQDMDGIHNEILIAIEQNAIDQVWVPAFEGGNPDHDALNAIASLLKDKVSVLEFAEYNFLGGKAQSQNFPAANGNEHVLQLTPEERAIKREALKLYKSEKSNLNYVKTEREAYRPLATYLYNHPPHEGKLWYTRFQWVPFKHPRVDFTKPEEVAQSITKFLKQL
jgi:LmbE family N-acetylglucosaminyl deacetylase